MGRLIVIVGAAKLVDCVVHRIHLVDRRVHDSSILQERLPCNQVVAIGAFFLSGCIAAEVSPEVWCDILLRISTGIASRLLHLLLLSIKDLIIVVLDLCELLDRNFFRRGGWLRHTLNYFLEDDVMVFGAKMPLNEFLGVQEVVNLINLILGRPYVLAILMNIRNKTLSQLLDIVDGNVNVHLLLGSLHEVVFR